VTRGRLHYPRTMTMGSGWRLRGWAIGIVHALAIVLLLATGAKADVRACQKAILKASSALTKQSLKRMATCLVKDNTGKVPGPCPDPVTAAKLAKATAKIEAKIAKACTTDDVTTLGFGGSCDLAADEGSAAAAACRPLPVTTSSELATCLTCWQRADLFELVSLLFASHAVEVCGDVVGVDSEVCSEGGCAAPAGPLPDQRDLGGGDLDCQRAIAKATFKYLLKRAKWLSKCALAGGTRQTCLADPKTQLRLAKTSAKTTAKIAGGCRNLRPLPNAPFCCRTGGNTCVAAGDRDACVLAGGQPQDGKVCGAADRCDNVPGSKVFPWWDECPLRTCDTFPVADMEDLDACVRGKADETIDAGLCHRFRGGGWPCAGSPSGAFLAEP